MKGSCDGGTGKKIVDRPAKQGDAKRQDQHNAVVGQLRDLNELTCWRISGARGCDVPSQTILQALQLSNALG
jgi:hypothetical protein